MAVEGQKRGHTFGQPDLFIAAIAALEGLVVVTRDTAEFVACGVLALNPWSSILHVRGKEASIVPPASIEGVAEVILGRRNRCKWPPRDEKVRGEGVADVLLADAVRRVIGAARSLAVFAIMVEAIDEKAAVFYRDFGFVPFPSRPQKLFMPTSEAVEAVSRALSR